MPQNCIIIIIIITKQTFGIVLLRFFRANCIVFISTVGFSNEYNCCQSQGIGKPIKKKLLKGIFRVD